ncbi:MAG: DNA mismatch repair protein MutS [Halanaerobiales bacterium]|nr:DNA mismatch repair protein MutS [Halanaerobiales bacterium]
MSELTPMMKQYNAIKRQYTDCLLFFRMGDFYEMFNEDAEVASRELEIALTSRNKGGGKKTPMAGVPHHSADNYIAQLIKKGYRVAICEQVEDVSEAKGLVRRDVVRVITPGTALDSTILQDDKNNYLGALILHQNQLGFAYVDISTGEFAVTEFDWVVNKVIDELSRIQPSELIISSELKDYPVIESFLRQQSNIVINIMPDNFNYQTAYQLLIEHFNTKTLHGFGCEGLKTATIAAGGIMNYLNETQKRSLSHINRLKTYSNQEYMILDAATRRNLELTATLRDGKRRGSLLGVLDRTVTAMGSRKLKHWIHQPLLSQEKIEERLSSVDELINHLYELESLKETLKGIYDIERLLGRIVYGSANGRDLIALKQSLSKLPEVDKILASFTSPRLQFLRKSLDLSEDVVSLIETAILDEPPTSLKDGGLIKEGFQEELDRLRDASTNGKEWITRLQQQERGRTGIKSLKVGFNKIFGYFLEVTKSNLHLVPEDYIRKQTLSNCERYVTPELKEKESLILGAEEKSVLLEYEIFVKIRDQVAQEMRRIQESAEVLAQLDVLVSFAVVTIENQYIRPIVTTDGELEIIKGRHPVVEDLIDQPFIPNNTYLDGDRSRFTIITGPNMSGKSTYMRQVALITLMAQIGSFVPAEQANIGLVDRIFTRVGASDDLTTGQSTFMVEMNEVANIVHHATKQSLIILDEVGRGTSTYDGLSIAWAVIEYIHNCERIGARTLFATHYHELTVLEDQLEGVKNYNIAVEENERDGIVFRHEIIPGAADQSYGIEVARLAGLPQEILAKAREILQRLEKENTSPLMESEEEVAVSVEISKPILKEEPQSVKEQQLSLFTPTKHPIVDRLREIDIMSITPMDAMNLLYQLKKEAEGK